jgi:hypothetical protein
MGMAASQARYLALVARQSNCEYEGQQINQTRLMLASQSANLFSQMLGLTVPVPPSSQDFTKTQYSFSDGTHNYVVDKWKQLPATDTDYNYMVNTYYFTDVYTGSMKRMADPQVQISNASSSIASLAQIETARAALRAAQEEMDSKYNHWQRVNSEQMAMIADIKGAAQSPEHLGRHLLANISGAAHPTDTSYTLSNDDNTYNINFYNTATPEAQTILSEMKNMLDLGVINIDELRAKLANQNPQYYIADASELIYDASVGLTSTQLAVLDTFGLAVNGNDEFLVNKKEIESIYENLNSGESTLENFYGYQIAGDDFTTSDDYMNQVRDCENVIANAKAAYDEVKDIYDERKAAYDALAQPVYIGNAPLTYLDQLTDEQAIELHQVVKDMLAQGIDTDIINRFDSDGNYLGGVYSFEIYGTTYYTTYDNLLDAYASNHQSNNYIDAQYRMPYYNASYINTRLEQQQKALMETDSSRRFTSIRFENDSLTYVLNTEVTTDKEAYDDAMNKYYYENAKYDKMVQDINAKTSIIHQQDQELELRMKQLETERNALTNEIEAVSKVVKDNVEASFKTFGG